MNAWLDSVQKYFETLGIHPMLGAFIAGVVVSFLLRRRSSNAASASVSSGMAPASASPSMITKSSVSFASTGKVTMNGNTVDLNAETMNQIKALMAQNNKIEAIKVLRHAAGLDLKDAKDIIEAFQASGMLK